MKTIHTLAPLAKLRQYKVNFVITPLECSGGFQLTRIVSEDITTALISAGGPGTETEKSTSEGNDSFHIHITKKQINYH